MRWLHVIALGVLALGPAQNQKSPKLEFEVASVRPSAPVPVEGQKLGLTMDGAQVRIVSLPLKDLLSIAYRVRNVQVLGPDWLGNQRFDIGAKLPDGAKSDQIPDMLQSLLVDRFQIKIHRDQKEFQVYALTLGKPPVKLKESTVDASAPAPAGISATGGAAGVSASLGNGAQYTFAGGKFEGRKLSAPNIATALERYVDRPMVDLTGLKGTYDLDFAVSPEDYQSLLFRAALNSGVRLPPQAMRLLDNGTTSPLVEVLEQFGLKVEARRSSIDVIAIDEIRRTPTDE